ncbi:hypothetical protein AB0I53_47220 [Saccharopolyspora sp. NPDC050389]|uniref:hypothetical protein n=1 Tax=Saccharopolyspora sp. NPDC050389 TaxID=3155516 RepID=UPI0033F884FF
MFEEDQGVQALQADGVDAQEVAGDHAGGLCGQELAPGRAAAAWGRIDAGCGQDFPDGGGSDWVSEAGQFALDLSPSAVFAGETEHELLDDRLRGRSSRSAPIGVVPASGHQLAVPGHQRARRDWEDLRPAAAGDQRGQGGKRPDGFIAWRASGAADSAALDKMLAKVTGR